MNKKKTSRPYVHRSTIWKNVGGGFSNPGETRICKIGKHKVLVSRSENLDRYGNPVHTATLIKRNGGLGYSCRGNGSATYTVECALRKNGIDTKK